MTKNQKIILTLVLAVAIIAVAGIQAFSSTGDVQGRLNNTSTIDNTNPGKAVGGDRGEF